MQLQLLWFLCMVWWKEVVILCIHLVILFLFPSSSVSGEKIKCQKLWKIKFFYFFPPPPSPFQFKWHNKKQQFISPQSKFKLSTLNPYYFFTHFDWKFKKRRYKLTSRVEIMNCLVSVYILLTGHLLGYKFFPFLWR